MDNDNDNLISLVSNEKIYFIILLQSVPFLVLTYQTLVCINIYKLIFSYSNIFSNKMNEYWKVYIKMLNPIKALLQILTFKLAFGKTLKCKVQLLFAHIYTTNSVIRCKVYSLLPPPTCKIQHHSMAYHIIQNRSVTYPPPSPPHDVSHNTWTAPNHGWVDLDYMGAYWPHILAS